MPFSDQRQFLVQIEGLSGFWAKLTGGNKSVPAAEAYDGGNPQPGITTGNPTIADITTSRAFDPDRDGTILASLKRQIGVFTTTITSIFTDPNFVPVGGSEQWQVILIDVMGPQVDAQKAGAQSSEIVLKWKPFAST